MKGRIRWLPAGTGEFWSPWYDLNFIPEIFKKLEVIAIEVKEEITKAEYEARYERGHK